MAVSEEEEEGGVHTMSSFKVIMEVNHESTLGRKSGRREVKAESQGMRAGSQVRKSGRKSGKKSG